MKKIKFAVLMIVIISIASTVNAQEQEMKYIFGGKTKIKVSGFIAPIMEYSAMGDNFAFFMGGGGGILLNQTVFFAGYGEGLTTQYEESLYLDYGGGLYGKLTNEQVSFGHGGFWMGYIHHSEAPIHAGISTKLGWGSIDIYDTFNKYYDPSELRDNVFVIIPQLEAEFNFFKWLKMNVGLGYRVVTGVNKSYPGKSDPIYDKKDFNKPEGTMTLMFGFFK